MPLLAIAAASQMIGSFTVAQQPDPISDETRAFAVLQDGDNSLKIGCNNAEEHRVIIVFETDKYLRNSHNSLLSPFVEYRFDKDKSDLETWNYDDHIAGIRQHKAVALFVSRLLKAQKLAMRLTDIRGENIDSVFQVEGARDAIGKIAEACADKDFSASFAAF